MNPLVAGLVVAAFAMAISFPCWNRLNKRGGYLRQDQGATEEVGGYYGVEIEP